MPDRAKGKKGKVKRVNEESQNSLNVPLKILRTWIGVRRTTKRETIEQKNPKPWGEFLNSLEEGRQSAFWKKAGGTKC